VEIVVMLAGVVSRYVLHQPLVWSDELAGILFLWLAMLGAVLALRCGEHMRMTALVSRLSPQRRAFVDTLAIAASIALLALLVAPAYDYASGEAAIVTPALQISNAWRALALPIGAALMLLVGLIRLAHVSRMRDVVIVLAIAVLLGAVAVFAGPWFQTLGKVNLVIFSSAWWRSAFSRACRSASRSRSLRSVLSAFPRSRRSKWWSAAWTKACRIWCCSPCRCSCSSAC
jgi:TRAP-type C4-dicarboxylate transport system permease small subunit